MRHSINRRQLSGLASIASLLTLLACLLFPVDTPPSAAASVPPTQQTQPASERAATSTSAQEAASTIETPAPVIATPTSTPAPAPVPAPRCKDTATLPNTIVIEDICLNTTFQRVGVLSTGEIDTPVSNVGLWGVEPGTTGTSLLDGHVFGVFSQLGRIHNGALVSVNANGTIYTYRVVGMETIALDQLYQNGKWDSILHPADGLSHATFITCAGHPIGGGQYSHRLFVYAVAV